MLYREYIKIKNLSIHFVGNKYSEKLYLSKETVSLDKSITELLISYFLKQFNFIESFVFYHHDSLKFNEVYNWITDIFNTSSSFFETTRKLANHLYEVSEHPKIKGGEFYVVYFKDCIFNGTTTDAIGLFKSENKDTFLKVYPKGDGYKIESEQGVNINKIDKGCLIFNIDKENGYIVSVVDNSNKGIEAKYWVEDFLNIKPRNDEYTKTQNVLSLFKSFISQKATEEFELNKAEQAVSLNKSLDYFKTNSFVSLDNFSKEVMQNPDMIKSFHDYKIQYEKDNDIEISESFSVSDSAVKKQARKYRSIIKLDKNFDIYVHGDERLIEQGEDKHGKFYKIYYLEEN